MLYTEKELLKLMGTENLNYHLGEKPLIKRCARAGLIIEIVERGKPNKYRIVENNMNPYENEKWTDLIYDNQYLISNYGRVKNKTNGRLLGYADGKGYIGIMLPNGYNLKIHRGVYFSFHPELFEQEQLFTIDHINGIKNDNRLENLRILSRGENSSEMHKNQDKIQSIIAQLIAKYGYEKTQEKLRTLL